MRYDGCKLNHPPNGAPLSTTTVSLDAIPAGTYNVDPAHSSVGFEVRHMGIATVRGAFRKFQGTIDATGDAPVLQGAVEVASIDSGDAQRDAHLASPEFFDADSQPEITFHSTAGEPLDGDRVRLTGEITIKGITKPIELTGVVAEGGTDPWGNERIGLELVGQIDRREFDLKWNQTLPNGNLLVSNEVKLLVSVSAVKAA
jgi:polyisoprenoid-binding protein YceI